MEDVAATLAAQRQLDPLVIDLARALSVATRIETELVRRMRLGLFPDSDAGLEVDLWFSPLVAERDAMGLTLVPEVRDELRRQLTLPDHRDVLERARQVIVACHTPEDGIGVPPVIHLHEAVTYHALAGAAEASASHRDAMQLEFGRLFNALDVDADGSLARWIVRALPTLPESARQSAAAIALAEKLRLRDTAIALPGVPRAEQTALEWLRAAPGGTIAVGCRLRTDGIELSIPPSSDAHTLELPATSPLVLEVQTPLRDGWHTRSVEFERTSPPIVPNASPGSRCRITTATGHRVAVKPTFESSSPTLYVFGLAGEDRSGIEPLNRAAADLGWTLSPIDDMSPDHIDDAGAVLLCGTRQRSDDRHFVDAVVQNLAISGSPLLALADDGIWRVGETAPGRTVVDQGEDVRSAVFSPDATRIVTSGPGGVRLWNAETGGLLTTQLQDQDAHSACFSPDGTRVLAGSTSGEIWLWTLDSGRTAVAGQHRDFVSARFSPSGTRIVTASQDSAAVLWAVHDPLQRRASLVHRGPVNDVSFSPDETLVATASDDGTAGIWHVATGQRAATLPHHAPVRNIAWSPDGRWIVTAEASGAARLWNASTFARERQSFDHPSDLHHITFSGDSRRIAVATADGSAWVWHVVSRTLMSPPLRHAARNRGVRSVDFSPDGMQLLTGGADSRVLVWDLTAPSTIDATDEGVETLFADLAPLEGRAGQAHIIESLRAHLMALDEHRLLVWMRTATATPAIEEPAAADVPPAEPVAGGERGDRAIIAFFSDGIDVLHDAFRDGQGQSRIIGIWNQRDPTGPPPAGFEFGTFHDREAIARYVISGNVPEALGRNRDGLGTVEASVAAGRSAGAFTGGVAPEASMLVVITSSDEPTGYSGSHVAALGFIDRETERLQLPVVVHVGQGMNAGAHDGRSLLEVGFDEFTHGGRQPGRAIVKSAGNEGTSDRHARLTVRAGTLDVLRWRAKPIAVGGHQRLELWWHTADTYRFRLQAPGGDRSEWIGEKAATLDATLGGVRCRMALTMYHADNGDNQLVVDLGDGSRGVAPGEWALEIEGVNSVRGGDIHAWIERGVANEAEFTTHVSREMTLSVPGTAESVITVGAVENDGPPFRAAPFTSSGPTRDGREKPDVAAPGVDVVGARGGTIDQVQALSGTSVAAAHVSGAVALVLSAAARDGTRMPNSRQIVAALRQTTKNASGRWDPRLGYGVIDIERFVAAFVATRLA